MQRRDFLKSTAAAAAGISLCAHASAAPNETERADSKPPNLLFVLADQWRFSAFGHGSDEVIETPQFDQFAGEGARFTRAYAANPVCTPNRSCLITGRYAHQHGMINNNLMLPPSEQCLAEQFASAGYATHYIGKWHMDGEDKPGFVPPGWRRRGFESFEGFNRGHWYPNNAQYFTDTGKLTKPGEFESAYQTDLALEFMKAHREKPFFCYLSWGPPHTPYRTPQKYQNYAAADIKWRPNVPAEVRKTERVGKNLAGYYDLCHALDVQFGRLMNGLTQLGLAENTLVVFTSDHGDMHGSHGLFFKGKPEEESMHVPLLMRWPKKIAAGQTPEVLFNSIDVMPSLLSLCGVNDPGTCTGRDLSASVIGGDAPDVESLYSQGAMRIGNRRRGNSGEWRALVTKRHKLVLSSGGEVTKLFDLTNDHFEQENLANQPAHRALQKELLAEARRWAKETEDPYPQVSTPAKKLYSDEEAAKASDS